MEKRKLHQMVSAAMLAALTCIVTLVLVIPTPFTMGGYINLGDCLVLLAGWLLGPVYGCAAAAIGSMLADVFTGYLAYAPATLIVKGVMAILTAVLFKAGQKAWPEHNLLARLLSAIAAELFMVLGYWGYEFLLLGNSVAAAASIPWNLIQGAVAIILAVPLGYRLAKANLVHQWSDPAADELPKPTDKEKAK